MSRKQNKLGITVFERGDAGGLPVGPDVIVNFQYELSDEEGELVDVCAEDESVEMLFGYAQAHPVIEEALLGRFPAAELEVTIPPESAFGQRDPELIIEVERLELPDAAQVGEQFDAEDADGRAVFLTVLELNDEFAILDSNHPLAGQSVKLRLKVLSTRAAMSEELADAASFLETLSLQEEAEAVQQQLLPASSLLRRKDPI